MNMNPVVHFEMPFDDRDRMVSFYEKAFGWKTQKFGPEMGEYVVATTTELDETGKFPKKPGRINGGFFKRSAENPSPSIVMAVTDIRDAMKKVEAAGGKIILGDTKGEPVMIPSVGLYIGAIDTEGNRISLLQPEGI